MSQPVAFSVGGVQTLTDAATITLDMANIPIATNTSFATFAPTAQVGQGNSFKVTLGGNRTLNVKHMVDGQVVFLYVTQDGTGSRLLTVQTDGVAALVATGTLLSTTAGATDLVMITFRADLDQAFVNTLGKAYS